MALEVIALTTWYNLRLPKCIIKTEMKLTFAEQRN